MVDQSAIFRFLVQYVGFVSDYANVSHLIECHPDKVTPEMIDWLARAKVVLDKSNNVLSTLKLFN